MKARGLCLSCYRSAGRRGTLLDHPKRKRTAVEFAEDYEVLRNLPVERIARRMGMTVGGVRQALWRARRRAS